MPNSCVPGTRSCTRPLIWVPIVHGQADLGSMSEAVQKAYLHKHGQAAWDRHVEAVAGLWRSTREAIERLGLDYGQVRLYQDGLPYCGHEAAIVRDLAQAGSANHQLLLELMAKGGRVVGTESPELLIEEYELMRQMLSFPGPGDEHDARQQHRALGKALLGKRDRYIAERIGQTLHAGETGLLFLGLLHSLEPYLPADIQMTRLPLDFDALAARLRWKEGDR